MERMLIMKKIILVLLSIALLLSLVGCGKLMRLKDGKIGIDKDGDNIVIDTGDGNITIGEDGGSLPKGYPKDIVPIIKGGKIIMSAVDTEDGIKSYMLNVLVEKEKKRCCRFL